MILDIFVIDGLNYVIGNDFNLLHKIMTLVNVSGTVKMSATAGDMSSTVKTFNMFLKILEWRLSFITLYK